MTRPVKAGARWVWLVVALVVMSPPAKPTTSALPGPSATPSGQTGQAGTAVLLTPDPSIVDKYCVGCHNDRLKTGGLSLQGLPLSDVAGHAQGSGRSTLMGAVCVMPGNLVRVPP